MAFIGTKQTLQTAVTIPVTSPATMGYVTGLAGAIGVLVRVWGGGNSTTNILNMALRLAANTNVATLLTSTTAPMALTMVAGAFGKTNGTADSSILYYFVFQVYDGVSVVYPSTIPTPCAQLNIAMATTNTTGATVEAWAVYAEDPRGGGVAADLNGA